MPAPCDRGDEFGHSILVERFIIVPFVGESRPASSGNDNPSDIARIVSAYRRMHEWADHRTEIPGVRLRRVDGGWTVVDLRATRVPGQRFLMVEFQPVGFSDEDDPVPPTDTGYPGRGPRRRSS